MISEASKADIRERLLMDVASLEEQIKTDKSLKLTKRERDVLKALPKKTLQKVDQVLSKYTPDHPRYDIRRELVLKAVAQIALHAKLMQEAYSQGSSAGEAYNG